MKADVNGVNTTWHDAHVPGRERYHVDMAKMLPVVYAVFVLLVLLGVTTIYLDLVNPVTL